MQIPFEVLASRDMGVMTFFDHLLASAGGLIIGIELPLWLRRVRRWLT